MNPADRNTRHPVKDMKLSQAGFDLIAYWEGVKLRAYFDSVDRATIGIGHIEGITDADVERGRTCTMQEAYQWFQYDAEDKAMKYMRLWLKVPLSQNEFDAITSFVFNRGCGRFRNGGMGEAPILPILNAGDYNGAAMQLLKFNWAGPHKEYLLGLDRRRHAECALFLGEPWERFKTWRP